LQRNILYIFVIFVVVLSVAVKSETAKSSMFYEPGAHSCIVYISSEDMLDMLSGPGTSSKTACQSNITDLSSLAL
jgi:hypothetical protein